MLTLFSDDNELTDFATGANDSHMTSLSLRNNRLESLDLSRCVGLRYLNVDENQLSTIHGLEKLQHLDVLAMRKQSLSEASSGLSILDQQIHARSLYLSSNAFSSLELPHSYHSVQKLELACCGLKELPKDFGLKFSNLRNLNLSFNALKDLRPLLNIPHLESLHVAGNRICRLRKTVAAISKMQHLRRFDSRDNPFTLGFYPPTATAANEQSLIPSSDPFDITESETETQIQRRAARALLLPSADRAADTEHCGRLDEDSKLRRRVYELMLCQGSRTLQKLDGLSFDRARIGIRDDVWNRLIDLGVMRRRPSSSSGETTRASTPICGSGA